MLALLHDPEAPHGIRLGETPDLEPDRSQVLVEVHTIALNFGEVAFIARRSPGEVPGWDTAGVVLESPPGGPPVGARVVAFGWSGGWAQRRLVDVANVAVLPDDVSFEDASVLPVAGVTALRAVRRLGSVLGRRVLVTGASGGVGGYAVQLLASAGAEVIGLSRRGASSVPGAGAARPVSAVAVVADLADLDPVDFVLDNVGGKVLGEALAHLTPGALVLSIGQASLEPTTIDFEALRGWGGATVEAFRIGDQLGTDLTTLLALPLDPRIGWRGSWHDVHAAIDARAAGKAVLTVAS
jgi:NADPH:quinone reductase-like Zn-dependent oxidoreductase